MDLDLSKFFDTVNHSKLLQLLSDKLKDGRVVSLIHKILRAPIQEGDKITPCEIGTPQGGPVSPVLANIMLNELDHELERRGHRFVRYADDMMIFCRPCEIGTPQGGPVSPVLANIMLNELDHELERRGHRFVRYADDMMIFCRSRKAAERTLRHLKPYVEGKLFLKLLERRGHRFVRYADDMMIFCRSRKAAERTLRHLKPYVEGKLFLKLNEQKTKICRMTDPNLKFLGFGFWQSRGIVKARPHQKSKAKCRQRLKAITSRSRGRSLEAYRKELKAFVCGWVNYFAESSMAIFVRSTDEWLRRRIRQ